MIFDGKNVKNLLQLMEIEVQGIEKLCMWVLKTLWSGRLQFYCQNMEKRKQKWRFQDFKILQNYFHLALDLAGGGQSRGPNSERLQSGCFDFWMDGLHGERGYWGWGFFLEILEYFEPVIQNPRVRGFFVKMVAENSFRARTLIEHIHIQCR